MKSFLQNIKSKGGQSLVEVVVAMGIIGISMAAMMNLVAASGKVIYQSEDSTKASVLATEAIEIVRNNSVSGCGLSPDPANAAGGVVFFVKSDTVDNSSPYNNDQSLVPTGSGNGDKIDNFSGFSRQILVWQMKPGSFNGYDFNKFSAAPLSLDLTKYYFVEVTIRKNGTEALKSSSIIYKR
ncbi:MAG: prepilin-type N-terminal cleavage/methylation domain-containing protein [bacterium]|nr:prepilin-type N-terminal cleavage/methylation domain-containing protein [bacterium]